MVAFIALPKPNGAAGISPVLGTGNGLMVMCSIYLLDKVCLPMKQKTVHRKTDFPFVSDKKNAHRGTIQRVHDQEMGRISRGTPREVSSIRDPHTHTHPTSLTPCSTWHKNGGFEGVMYGCTGAETWARNHHGNGRERERGDQRP